MIAGTEYLTLIEIHGNLLLIVLEIYCPLICNNVINLTDIDYVVSLRSVEILTIYVYVFSCYLKYHAFFSVFFVSYVQLSFSGKKITKSCDQASQT